MPEPVRGLALSPRVATKRPGAVVPSTPESGQLSGRLGTLPGGHIDGDETMAEALVRELDEELGVRIEKPEPFPWETVHFDGVELNIFIVDRW